MRSIKKMLLGITILLGTICLHLFLRDLVWLDAIGLVGLIVSLGAYFDNEKNS